MGKLRYFKTSVVVCCLAFHFASFSQQLSPGTSTWQVYFSPHGRATDAIVDAIDEARACVLVQAYSFTSEPIAEALQRAHRRGVRVQVILDKSQRTQKYSIIDLLTQASIPTLIDADHAIAHNKVMIIDDRLVITGSFNFTKAAEERNAENVLILRSNDLAAKFLENWRIHQRHSTPYSQRRLYK